MPARRAKRPSLPDDLKEAILEGLNSIERGDFIELHTQEDLRRYFSDIIERGKMRLAAEARHRAVAPKYP
jgi:hypothetical protein